MPLSQPEITAAESSQRPTSLRLLPASLFSTLATFPAFSASPHLHLRASKFPQPRNVFAQAPRHAIFALHAGTRADLRNISPERRHSPGSRLLQPFATMLSLLALFAVSCAAQSVTLPAGTLTGGTCASLGEASYANSNASYFYSIPYAQPPLGQLRFAAPQAYNGTLGQATQPSPRCPQLGQEFIEPDQSEDW